ncbi:MAG: hypothetical protein ACXVLQ_17325 [Bacteriovorax sp.]
MRSKLLLLLCLFSFFALSSNSFATAELSSEQKSSSLYQYLTKKALKNGTPDKEDGYTFTQQDIGRIAYYLDYYLYTVEDLRKTEDLFFREQLKISDKNLDDIVYLLRSFEDVGKIMREHQQFTDLKCKFLYGKNQDHALEISPVIQQMYKSGDDKFVPAFVGGCWYPYHYPENLFPSYLAPL